MAQERWKDVVGYEVLYQVSDMGRVKSLQYHKTIREKILKPWRNKNGNKYRLMIGLSKDQLKRRFYVHQLVASAFIGLCPPDMEICHNDGNPQNNCVNNIRYGTHKNNMEDMVLHGHSNVGIKNPNCKLTKIQLLQIIDLINDRIPCIDIADKFGISVSIVYSIRRKDLWQSLTQDIKIDRARIATKQNRGSTKLTNDDLNAIRELININMKSSDIALQFNVSFNTINRIRKNITFRSSV